MQAEQTGGFHTKDQIRLSNRVGCSLDSRLFLTALKDYRHMTVEFTLSITHRLLSRKIRTSTQLTAVELQ